MATLHNKTIKMHRTTDIKTTPLTQARYWFDWSSELQSVSVAFSIQSSKLCVVEFWTRFRAQCALSGVYFIRLHFFEQFGMWTKHTKYKISINKLQGKEMLNGSLWVAVRYWETPRQSRDKLCSCVFVYVREEGRKQQDTGSGGFLLAACCVLRCSALSLAFCSASRETKPSVRLLQNGQNLQAKGFWQPFRWLTERVAELYTNAEQSSVWRKDGVSNDYTYSELLYVVVLQWKWKT